MSNRISEVLSKLDPNKDDHWTMDGLPQLEVVSSLSGFKVTRKQITDARPGFTRLVAQGGTPGQDPGLTIPDAEKLDNPDLKPDTPETQDEPEPATPEEIAKAEEAVEKAEADIVDIERAERDLKERRKAAEQAVTDARAHLAVVSPAPNAIDCVRAMQEQSAKQRAVRRGALSILSDALGTKVKISDRSPLDQAIGDRKRNVGAMALPGKKG
jgi:hypothetical protein